MSYHTCHCTENVHPCISGSKYSNNRSGFLQCIGYPFVLTGHCDYSVVDAHIGEMSADKIAQSSNIKHDTLSSDNPETYAKESTSGFKLLSVKHFSKNKRTRHVVKNAKPQTLSNGNGSLTSGSTTYYAHDEKQSHLRVHHYDDPVNNNQSTSDSYDVEDFEDTDEPDDDGFNDYDDYPLSEKITERHHVSQSNPIFPHTSVFGHHINGNDIRSNSYATHRQDGELPRNNHHIEFVPNLLNAHNGSAELPMHSSLIAPADNLMPYTYNHASPVGCNCLQLASGFWDIHRPAHLGHLLSDVPADHFNNSHFCMLPAHSIQTAPVSGHSTPHPGDMPIILNETSSVPESTSFYTATVASNGYLAANNCEPNLASTVHSNAPGLWAQIPDNGQQLTCPHDHRHHQHPDAPMLVDSGPLQHSMINGSCDRTNLPNCAHGRCVTVPLSAAAADSVAATNAVESQLSSAKVVGSGPTSLPVITVDQVTNAQVTLSVQSTSLSATLQPASRFRKARIYETVEQWSHGRTSVHDCRLKVIPEWVMKLHRTASDGTNDDLNRHRLDRKNVSCLACLQSEAFDYQRIAQRERSQVLPPPPNKTVDPHQSDLNSTNGRRSKISNLFSFWDSGCRVNARLPKSVRIYLSALHAREHRQQSGHTDRAHSDIGHQRLSKHAIGENDVCTSDTLPPNRMPPGQKESTVTDFGNIMRYYSPGPEEMDDRSDRNSPLATLHLSLHGLPPEVDTSGSSLQAGHHRLDPATAYLRRHQAGTPPASYSPNASLPHPENTTVPLSSPSFSAMLPGMSTQLPSAFPDRDESTRTEPVSHAVASTLPTNQQEVVLTQQNHLPDLSKACLSRGTCASTDYGSRTVVPDAGAVGGQMTASQHMSSTVAPMVSDLSCRNCRRSFMLSNPLSACASVNDHRVIGHQTVHEQQELVCCNHHSNSLMHSGFYYHSNPTSVPGSCSNRSYDDSSHDPVVLSRHLEALIHESVDGVRSTLVNTFRDIMLQLEMDRMKQASELSAYRMALHQLRPFVPLDAWAHICGDLALSPHATPTGAPPPHALQNSEELLQPDGQVKPPLPPPPHPPR